MGALEDLTDWHAVHELSIRWAEALDQRNWPALRSTLAGRLHMDLSGSPPAGGPGPIWVDDWIGEVSRDLARFTTTQHLLGNHRIALHGDQGRVRAEVQVQHWMSTHRWHQVGGWYEATVVREQGEWAISGVTFHQTWETGDPTL